MTEQATQATVTPERDYPTFALLPAIRIVGRPTHLTLLAAAGDFPTYSDRLTRGTCVADGDAARVYPSDLLELLSERVWLRDEQFSTIAKLSSFRIVNGGALECDVEWRPKVPEVDAWIRPALRVDRGVLDRRVVALWCDLVSSEHALPSWLTWRAPAHLVDGIALDTERNI